MASASPTPVNADVVLPTEELVIRPYGKVILSLDNVLLPPERTDTSPSRSDGLDEKSERELRFLGCELIQTAGILLRVPQVAMASGQVLFQRFYYSKSLVRMPMEHTAMAALCLASKIEEAPRRIRDIVNVFHHIRQVRAGKKISPLILDQNYINLKNQVIKAERRILKELGFCVHVKHPHKLIVTYLNLLKQEKNTQLMQLCWNYMNDSLRSDVFVRYTPEAIACACIFLGARQVGVPLPKDPQPWYELFDVTTEEVEQITATLLDLYRIEKPDLEKLEQHIAELEKAMKEAKVKARILAGGSALSAGNTPIGAGTSGALSPQTSFSNNPSPSALDKENRASSVPNVENRVDLAEEMKRVNNNNEKENGSDADAVTVIDGGGGEEEEEEEDGDRDEERKGGRKSRKRRSSSPSGSPAVQKRCRRRRRRSGSERNGHRSRSCQLENGKSTSRSASPSEASSSDHSQSPAAKVRPKSYSRGQSRDRKSSSRRKDKRDKRRRSSRSRDRDRNSRHRRRRSRHVKKDKGRSASPSASVSPPRRRDDRREGKSKRGRAR